ncbi:hypothetical protein [Thiocapsa sp.]|uniref:hypothetical protein n=1 Tax=Thiocapsa sp. TaxID=2024551 RepID=UPI001BCFADC2|nr:hypothetical protein [Thiocapsa sp.]
MHRPSEDERRAVAAHFDRGYYLASNSDVRDAGIDPLTHFLESGWREGRNPSRFFDTGYYLAKNPDVAAAGINPLLHFIWAGSQEGRQRRRPLDAFRRQLEDSVSPRVKAKRWIEGAERSPPISKTTLSDAVEISSASRGLILSLSHDDYARNYGGVQLVIGDEQATFSRTGWRYLHVSPAIPLPMLADPEPADDFAVSLRIDTKWTGVARFVDLIAAVAEQRRQGIEVRCVIHHLMGFAPEFVFELLRASGDLRPIVWIHDFFTLCPSYALMRNDVDYCGAPPPMSVACNICSYGEERKPHLKRIREFFEAVHPSVLAPSEIALSLWRRGSGLPHAQGEACPIARIITAPSERSTMPIPPGRPLRVAHLGARAFLKGWSIFEDLALHLANDGRYEFLQLGSPDSGSPLPSFIRNIPVIVDTKQRNAMVEAIAESRIDVVVSWQLCPETFSLSVHEALVGGAFVVARIGAGNVWPAVAANAPDQGCAVADEAALFGLFDGDRLREFVESSPKLRGALLPIEVTANWLRTQSTNRAQPTLSMVAEENEKDT